MSLTYKLHQKFQYTWPEYQPGDIVKVCKAIVKHLGLRSGGYDVRCVQDNWSRVCSFLTDWEGK